MQIGHQGAQNSRMTGEPLYSARLKVVPSKSFSVNAGAGVAAAGACAGSSAASKTAPTASTTKCFLTRNRNADHLEDVVWYVCNVPAQYEDFLKRFRGFSPSAALRWGESSGPLPLRPLQSPAFPADGYRPSPNPSNAASRFRSKPTTTSPSMTVTGVLATPRRSRSSIAAGSSATFRV